MLSIGKLGAGQTAYYQRQVAQGQDDYYSGRGEAPGSWTGRGARALGLEGRVDADRFHALMRGIDPSDPELGRRLRDSPGQSRVVGFDLTFSAPKSVSVLATVGDARTAGELVAAHEAAVAAALEYVEDEAVRVRRGKDGHRVQPGEGVVAAAYRHRMSRALDPQLHTHVVCANVACGPDGRWTALDGRALYEHAQTAGYLYQAHLREQVRERLGLEWGPVTNGMAELSAVPEGVLQEFSRRRAEIVEAAREAGVEDLASARGKHMAIVTRERKQYGIDTGSWREEVRARAAEHGLDAAVIERVVGAGRRGLAWDGWAAGRVDERELCGRLAGPAGLTERSNTFSEREVLREFAAGAGQGADAAEVRAQAARFLARGDVLETVGGGLTTLDLVEAERRVIASTVGRAGEGAGEVDAATLERSLARSERPLSAEQAGAVRGVVGSGNGVDVIEALAGTGKTYTAGVLRRVYEDAGYRVIGVAPTGRAVRELAEEAGTAAWTLDRALIDLDRGGGGLPERAVVIFDEAGMAATRPTGRLLDAAQEAGAKVVAIGDSGQLASVQAGGWMRAVGERLGAHRLTQVMRQRDPQERRALARLHDGQSEHYLGWASEHDRVVVHTGEGARAAALEDWKHATGEHGVTQVLIARDNATRAALNEAARAEMRAQGRLGEDVAYGPITVAVGDRVICRRNDRAADVDNGTRGTVRATNPDRVVLETDAGPVRELPAAYAAEHVEHAHCLTGHGMQGGTVEHATVIAAPSELTHGWSYTALSRARQTTRLHIEAQDVDRARDRRELAPQERPRRSSRDDVLERVAARMRVRDDEDLAIEQLPAGPAPGRADDPELGVRAGAAPATTTGRGGERERLRQVRDELSSLRAQRMGLPLRELHNLYAIDAEARLVAEQRAEVAGRLERLPAPDRTRLGRSRDAHAAERARLTVAIATADQQLDALAGRRDELAREAGPVEEVRAERDGLERRIAALEREQRQLGDRLAERDVADPPAWAHETFGPRPANPRSAGQWDRGVRAVARYRAEHDVPEAVPGLGPTPHDTEAAKAWREASTLAQQVQRRIGRDIDRSLGRDTGHGHER